MQLELQNFILSVKSACGGAVSVDVPSSRTGKAIKVLGITLEIIPFAGDLLSYLLNLVLGNLSERRDEKKQMV